jgi:hypothetical protein
VLSRGGFAFVGLTVAATIAGCSSILTAEPTPVPGAAATLTRSSRTAIPTPVRTAVPSPSLSAVPSRSPGASPAPSPSAGIEAVNEDEIAQLQQRMQQIVGSPDLTGVESLLLDHVSLSTPQGGSVMSATEAETWLRDHAGPGMKVSRLERATQALMLQVFTTGWPKKDPVDQGQLNFSLRRYDASGRLDDENGDWKIDVIEAE